MESESIPTPTKPVPKRKGKLAKHRDAEKFRFKKNQGFDSSMVEKFTTERTLPNAVTSMFSDLSYTPTIRPPVPTLLSLTVLPTLVKLVCEFMSESCKVKLVHQDIITMVYVTYLQVQARVFKARTGTPYPPDFSSEGHVSKITKVLRENVFPLTHYIKCVGKVKFENQLHVPEYTFDDDAIMKQLSVVGYSITTDLSRIISMGPDNPLFYGSAVWVEFVDDEAVQIARARGILRNDGLMFTQEYLSNPRTINLAGLVNVTPPRLLYPTIDEVITRFHSIMAKVQKRIPQVVEQIDFEVEGHPCILVGCRERGTIVEAWSDRFLTDEAMVLGAVLQFGLDDDGPPERVCQLSDVETSGALHRYARIVVERAQVS